MDLFGLTEESVLDEELNDERCREILRIKKIRCHNSC